MRMKKLLLLSVLAVILPSSVSAQDDDMYFVPTKKNVEKAKQDYGMPRDTYYSGSNRSVDDYNRRYVSTVQAVDSLGNVIAADSIGSDIIGFDGVAGVYPDSLGDYTYTRQMSRWDDYEWRDGYRAGYTDGRWGRWGWSSYYYPYYSGWYGGWYDPWYDPWYYGGWGYWGYAGWYYPWYGWGYPGYWHGYWHSGWYPGGGIAWARRSTGTRNHSSSGTGGYNYRRYNSIGGDRSYANRGTYNGTASGNRNNSTSRFGGVRNSNTNNNTYQQNNSYNSSSRNSSFGGTRSSGGSFGGGSRGGGGGHFGGGRR